jgi:4-hydroxybenzoate polyprenyltransferase
MNLKSFLNLVRYKNLGMMALSQVVVIFVFLDKSILENQNGLQLLVICISTLLISAAGYVINDYFDVKIDQINKPQEVIVGRLLSRRKALLLNQVLNGIAILVSVYAGYKVVLINILAINSLWLYAFNLKKKALWGNILVAFLLSLILLELAWIYDFQNPKIWYYAFLVFFLNLVREIIKDLEDIEGDSRFGAYTLAVLLPLNITKKILYGIVGFSLLILGVWSLFLKSNYLIIGTGVLVFSIYILYLIYKSDKKKDFSQMSTLIKYFLFLGLFSSLLLK